MRSLNVAPGYVRVFGPSTTLAVNPYYRLDQVWYFPSADPLSDQTTTLSQQRRLTNAGLRADVAYTKGKHNAKFGAQVSHTFLTEAFQFGVTDPDFNDPASDAFLPGLLPFDLTRGGRMFFQRPHRRQTGGGLRAGRNQPWARSRSRAALRQLRRNKQRPFVAAAPRRFI